MSSSYPSPPNTPTPARAKIDRDLARRRERSPPRTSSNGPLTPPTSPPRTPSSYIPRTIPTAPLASPPITPSKSRSVAGVNSIAVPVAMDPATLKTLLGLDIGKCGSPTKYEGNPPCKMRNPLNIESQIRAMIALTQASRELLEQLELLADLALCMHHIKPVPKAARIKVWKKAFPVGDEKAVPVEPIEDQINNVLNCFPYTSAYTCVGVKRDRDSTLCGFRIGGKKVLKGKKTVALILKLENYSHDSNLAFLLNVLASNMFCYHHTEQIPEWVAKRKSRITAIYKAFPKQDRPLTPTSNIRSPRKLEGDYAKFWEDADDTSAFVTEIEKDRPSDYSACYSLIRDKMMEPLQKPELDEGYVYVYEVEGNKGFVKIGYTTQTIKERSEQWKSECDRVPKVLYPLGPTKKVPHAKRVEGLCLAELKYRNMTVICEACPKRHIEWVQVPAAEAIAAIQKWTKWIETAPYKDSKKRLTQWELRNDVTSWTLMDEQASSANDMPKFMQERAVPSLPAKTQSLRRDTLENVSARTRSSIKETSKSASLGK